MAMRVRSSAKNRWESLGPVLEILIGSEFLRFTSLSIFLNSLFIHKMNSYGDIGSPCLMPLKG